MRSRWLAAIAFLALAVDLLISSIYVISEGEQGLIVRLGAPIGVVNDPGLKVKAPFIDTVYVTSTRSLLLEPPVEQAIMGDHGLYDVLVARQHLTAAAGLAAGDCGEQSKAKLDLVDLRHFGKQRCVERVGQVNVQAGVGRPDPFTEAQGANVPLPDGYAHPGHTRPPAQAGVFF